MIKLLHSKMINISLKNLRYYKKKKKTEQPENIDDYIALKHEDCGCRHTFKILMRHLFLIYGMDSKQRCEGSERLHCP